MKNSESVIADIKARSKALSWTLDERMRRLWAAAEAEAMGHGGVMAVFKAVGISPGDLPGASGDRRAGVFRAGGGPAPDPAAGRGTSDDGRKIPRHIGGGRVPGGAR